MMPNCTLATSSFFCQISTPRLRERSLRQCTLEARNRRKRFLEIFSAGPPTVNRCDSCTLAHDLVGYHLATASRQVSRRASEDRGLPGNATEFILPESSCPCLPLHKQMSTREQAVHIDKVLTPGGHRGTIRCSRCCQAERKQPNPK